MRPTGTNPRERALLHFIKMFRRALYRRVGQIAPSLVAALVLVLTACTPSAPPRVPRTFVPPQPSAPRATQANVEFDPATAGAVDGFSGLAVPLPASGVPHHARPTDTEFTLKAAEDLFAAGKRALQEGRADEARASFDKTIDILLAAPADLPDRAAFDRRFDEIIDAIYHYDVDLLGAKRNEETARYEQTPLEGILEMTFPVEPSVRDKVQRQLQHTVSKLPLEATDPVVSFINFFSTNEGRKVLAFGLKRQGRYKAMIDQILQEEGVPPELIFVAQAESGFQARARSNKACVGVWQFAAFRGKEYGLNLTPAIDERMDPEKATRAAARHLRDLYEHFGDWYLALAAYNCGPNCVDAAISRTGYADFWALRRLGVLPQETSNYVSIIVAMTIMAKNPAEYGLDFVEPDPAIAYDSVELKSATHLALVADAVDRPLSELKELNPALLRLVAPAGLVIHIPAGTTSLLDRVFAAIPQEHRDTWRIHRVQPEDSFETVARRFGMNAATVSTANADQLPVTGEWMAIPAAYPGDPVPVRLARKTPVRSASRNVTARATAKAGHVPVKSLPAPQPVSTASAALRRNNTNARAR